MVSSAQERDGSKFRETMRYGQLRLCKRADSGIWYVVFRHPVTRKRREKSLSTTLKSEAIRQADALSAQITNGKLGVADGAAPLRHLFDEFFLAMDGHIKPKTVKRLLSSRHVFEQWLSEMQPDVRLVRDVTSKSIREFQQWRLSCGAKERTINNDVTNLHTVFLWGGREKLVAASPCDYSKRGSVKLYKGAEPLPDTYSPDEYRLLLAEAEKQGDLLIRDLIILLANTGMRFSEAANLVPEALLWKAEIPLIDIRARGNGWSPKDSCEEKQIPMFPEVQEVLRRRAAAANGGYLFTTRTGKRIPDNHTRERLQRLFPAVGIDNTSRRLHCHSWRNYFIKKCLDDGALPHRIMTWTGHDSYQMVMRYASARDGDEVGLSDFKKMMQARELARRTQESPRHPTAALMGPS